MRVETKAILLFRWETAFRTKKFAARVSNDISENEQTARLERSGRFTPLPRLSCGRRGTDCPRIAGIHWSWVSNHIGAGRGGGSGRSSAFGYPPGSGHSSAFASPPQTIATGVCRRRVVGLTRGAVVGLTRGTD